MDIEILKERYPLQLGANKPILRTTASLVKKITDEYRELADALLELMHYHKGVGLAAPQINQPVRMCAVTQREITPKGDHILLSEQVLINPELVGSSDKKEVDLEACLSLPGMEGGVARARHISVKFTTIEGEVQILKATGYNARIILHEIDHLDGVLFIDKLVE